MPSTGGVKIGGTYDEARTRKVNAEAEIAELELAKVRGELVVVDDVIKAWESVLMAVKAKMMSVPTKAAPVVASEGEAGKCQAVIEDLVREALEELESYDPKVNPTTANVESSEDGAEGDEAAAPAKRQRVGRPRKTTRLAKQ
jgi:hypothetical protein